MNLINKINIRKTFTGRGLLLTGLILVVVGVFSYAGKVDAEAPTTPLPSTPTTGTMTNFPTATPTGTTAAPDPCASEGVGLAYDACRNAKSAEEKGQQSTGFFHWLNPFEWGPALLGWLAYIILQIMGLILGLAGLILNFVIKTTIVDMSANINKMEGINIAWKVLRDIMNIGFIFLLVYEAILLIIDQGSIANIKKFITGIVLASLLINFSLFFTKVIIDASNVATVGLYNSILSDTGAVDATSGLSNAYQQALGLQGFFALGGIKAFSSLSGGGDNYKMLTVGLMASVLFLITSFVFFSVSVMFVVRYIVLIVLMVLSPIAYMGMAYPSMGGIKKYAGQWWESLWGQVLFAPVFMLMTWVVLILITSPGFTGIALDPAKWTAFAGGTDPSNTGSINLFFNFALVIGLAIASLVISKQFATQGSSQIGKLSGEAMSFAGGAVMGGTARLQRNTLGRWGASQANNEELKKKAAEGNVRARMTLAAANKAATSSFDVRATNKFSSLAKTSGVDFGKVDSKKENYKAIREEEVKKAEAKAKQYKPSDAAYAEAKEKDRVAKEAGEAADVMAKNLNTDEWKASAEGKAEKAKADLDKANEKVTEAEAQLVEKEKEMAEAITDEQKAIVEREIEALQVSLDRKKADSRTLTDLVDRSQPALLAAQAKRKELKEMRDASKGDNESALNSEYQRRVGLVAARVGHEDTDAAKKARARLDSGEVLTEEKRAELTETVKRESFDTGGNKAMRGLNHIVRGTTSTIFGGSMPMSKKEREAVARKIRGVAKEKTKKEKAQDAALAAYLEEEEEKKTASGVSPSAAAEPAPTAPAPPPPPTPTPPPAGP